MKLTGVIRIGKDAELRSTQSGTSVCGIIGVFDYGRKDQNGKKPSQWVELAMFGKQADALAGYLTKGAVVDVTANEIHIETYEGKNGTVAKLVGKVIDIAFVPKQAERQDYVPPSKPQASGGIDLEDIPFAALSFHG